MIIIEKLLALLRVSSRRARRPSPKQCDIGGMHMREEYDFSDSIQNPYVRKEHKQVTMNLDVDIVDYFKMRGAETGIPYQRLINLYLSQCVAEDKRLTFV